MRAKREQIEIMAPAGGYEQLIAAVQGGADSVYFGVEQLNMRARATMNFTMDDLEKIAEICQENDMKSYLTLNTIIYDHDLSLVRTILQRVQEAGITAIIASDQAVISMAHSMGIEVHISTQVNITNVETIRFYANFADVMVLSRELSLMQVKSIVDAVNRENICGPSGNPVQIEVFAHGALCMAVSGKCYLSLHSHNASANRGACVQNCRRKYKVTDLKEPDIEFEIDNEYIMSPKDLCTINFLDELLDTGVQVLKIEGRGKGAEYVKTVSRCYKEAVYSLYDGAYSQEKVDQWMEKLGEVYNRGFWGGYYLGQKLGEWTNTSGSKATTRKIYLGRGVHYYSNIGVAEFKIETNKLSVGDRIMITGPTSGAIEAVAEEIHVDGKPVQEAPKGVNCGVKLSEKVRASDKLYKIVKEI
jgi:U32 family peptidase